jgi:hypothetical protein
MIDMKSILLLTAFKYASKITILTWVVFLLISLFMLFDGETFGYILYGYSFYLTFIYRYLGILFFNHVYLILYLQVFQNQAIYFISLISIGLLCICILLYAYTIIHYFNPLGTKVNFFQDGILNHSIIGWVFSLYLLFRNKNSLN